MQDHLQDNLAFAEEQYRLALEIAERMGDTRAELKIEASLANCVYLSGGHSQREQAIAWTREVLRRCESGGIAGSVARLARENIAKMEWGETDLLIYDMLRRKT